MSSRSPRPIRAFAQVAVLAIVAASPAPALAIQPLEDFVKSARTNNLETAEAKANVAQREAEADQAWSRVLPALSARASYTRNELSAEVTVPGRDPIVITPNDQLDASLSVEVPLVDVAAWSRIGSARATAKAASARADATTLDVERAIAERYLQAVAGRALVLAAQSALDAALASQKVADLRGDAGATGSLEPVRAAAEVARAEQSLAEAKRVEAVARRALTSLTGLTPAAGAPALKDDLHAEGSLDSWEKQAPEAPAVRAAALESEAQSKQTTAAWSALLPTVSASATQRFTNATGFAGQNASYTLGVTASWRLDFGAVRQIGAQQAAADAASVRKDKAERDAKDRVFEAHQAVSTQIAKSKAARAEARAATRAAELARERYRTGAGTQLDTIQADRDALRAEVNRIQVDTDLLFARMTLRLAAGKPLSSVPIGSGGADADKVSEDTKSEDTKSEDTKSEDTKSEDTKSEGVESPEAPVSPSPAAPPENKAGAR